MSEYLNLGDKVPVVFQSSIGEAGLFVRAIIKDETLATLATLSLAHVSRGLYQNDSFQMPARQFLTVQYEVFKDAGFTIPDDTYFMAIDVFELVEVSGGGGTSESLNDIVAFVTKGSENILAKVGGSTIKAVISDVIVKVDETVVAYISSNQKSITAKIGGSQIRAVLTDCVC